MYGDRDPLMGGAGAEAVVEERVQGARCHLGRGKAWGKTVFNSRGNPGRDSSKVGGRGQCCAVSGAVAGAGGAVYGGALRMGGGPHS